MVATQAKAAPGEIVRNRTKAWPAPGLHKSWKAAPGARPASEAQAGREVGGGGRRAAGVAIRAGASLSGSPMELAAGRAGRLSGCARHRSR